MASIAKPIEPIAEVDTTHKIIHCFIWLFLIGIIYPIYRILHHVFGKHSGVRHSSKKKVLKYSIFTKYFLLISVALSYTYLIVTSIQTLLMFVNGYVSEAICPLFALYRMFSYTAGRVILYLYFISRANDIFTDTYLAFNKCSVLSLGIYCITFSITLVVPSGIIYYNKQQWYIASDTDGNGSYCISEGDQQSLKYVFVWGSLNDLFYSIVTIAMMVSRLFILLKDNERKKSRTKRYDFASSSDHDGHGHVSVGDMSPRETTQTEQTNPNIDNDINTNAHSPSPPPQPQPQQQSLSPRFHFSTTSQDVSSAQNKPMFAKRISTQIGNKSIEIKKIKVAVSKNDAAIFHKKTAGHNKLILLISKFFIILTCLVVSSQMVLVLFMVFRDLVTFLYSMDTFVNMICLFLTFAFSDEYYNKYFCGKCCTPCCFPLIKTLALSLDEYEKKYQMAHNMRNWFCHNRCCIYCRCCCCASCRYCCFGESLSKEIYDLARQEIDLIVKEEHEKKMANKISSQSQDTEHTAISQTAISQ